MSLKAVKNKIKSISKTRQVTKAMEAVSAVKMRKSQALAIGTRPYALSAFRILKSVAGSVDAARHPLLEHRPVKRTLLLVISADKGLAGSFGASLMKGVNRFMDEKGLTKENATLITVGRKAHEYFAKRGYEIIAHHERWSDGIDFDDVRPLAALMKEGYTTGKFDDAHIVYTHFISTLKQKVFYEQLLPVSFESVEAVVKGILPESGKYAKEDAGDAPLVPEVTFEPSPEEVLSELIPALFNIQIFHSVLESNAESARL
jgi:F-type H+-transporting ATPase subunit gamma